MDKTARSLGTYPHRARCVSAGQKVVGTSHTKNGPHRCATWSVFMCPCWGPPSRPGWHCGAEPGSVLDKRSADPGQTRSMGMIDDRPDASRHPRSQRRERRARLGVRHALSGSSRVRTPEEAARSVVCLHGTDPPSVHLSCWARCDSVSVADVEQALHGTRSIIRQQSMRETLFVFPRDLVPAVWGSAAARVAATHRKRLIKDLERWGPAPDGEGNSWLRSAEGAVLDRLADGIPRSSKDVRAEVPEVGGVIDQSPGTRWGGRVAIAPKVLAQLSLRGVVARAGNGGPWFTSRPTWTTTHAWWEGDMPDALSSRERYAEFVARLLWSYGPGNGRGHHVVAGGNEDDRPDRARGRRCDAGCPRRRIGRLAATR